MPRFATILLDLDGTIVDAFTTIHRGYVHTLPQLGFPAPTMEQVRRAVGWVRGLGRFETYRGLVREDVPLIPEKALREAVVNAVAHRDYAITGSKVLLEVFSDRLDVTSPGLLPNHMTVDSVRAGGHPRSRNELMANYLLVTGLMEQRGRGWPVMRRAMREFNETDVELLQDEGGKFVRVTLRLRRGPAGSESARRAG